MPSYPSLIEASPCATSERQNNLAVVVCWPAQAMIPGHMVGELERLPELLLLHQSMGQAPVAPDVVLKQMPRGPAVLLLSVLADNTLGGQLQQQKGSAALASCCLPVPPDPAVGSLLLGWSLNLPAVPNASLGLLVAI